MEALVLGLRGEEGGGVGGCKSCFYLSNSNITVVIAILLLVVVVIVVVVIVIVGGIIIVIPLPVRIREAGLAQPR